MTHGKPAFMHRYTIALLILLILSLSCIPVLAASAPLPNNRHIFINVANDAGVKFNLDGPKYSGPSNTYYIKADGGGLNELHITNDLSDPYGQVTTTTDQSGVFYVTNTGGRGFDNDIILLIAVKEPVPDDFSVRITSGGYTWTPAASGAYTPRPPTDYAHVSGAISESFSKPDFIYGPQNWKPGPGALGDKTLPIVSGQDMTDATETYRLMFVDLKAGNMHPNKFPGVTLTDNGAVKVEYSFSNHRTFAAFSAYGWCSAANQDQGISWTNPTRGFIAGGGAKQSGQSGLSVIGTAAPSSPGHTSSGGAALPAPGSAVPVDPDRYGYKGRDVSTYKTDTVNGSVRFFFVPDNGPQLISNRIRDFNLTLDLPPGANITFARMYVYISDSHYVDADKGVIPSYYIRMNTTFLEPDKMYIDTRGSDNGPVLATSAYDVRGLLTGNGTYTFSLRNQDQDQSVFTLDKIFLVTAFEQANAPNTSYWIHEECDSVLSQPEKGVFPGDTETRYSFSGAVNMSTAGDAYLYLVSTGLDYNSSTDHMLSLNEKNWYNILDNDTVYDNQSILEAGRVFENENLFENNQTFSVAHLQVRHYLNETGNDAVVRSAIRTSDPDYIVNRNAFLIVEYPESNSSARNATLAGYLRNVSASGGPSEANESDCCRITIDSDPEGALISIDGSSIGKATPYTLEVPKGETHTAGFELDGYTCSDVQFYAMNSTTIRQSLYAPVHSTKGRLVTEPDDPDGTRYGGLYIHSRPHSATISINGVSTGKTAPAVFLGLEPGTYTVSLGKLQDILISENGLFDFRDQEVRVQPDMITLVDINGIGTHIYSDIIVDSRHYRGKTFTVNGIANNETIPARITVPLFHSFITIHENESYISYPVPLPYIWDEERYLLFEPREHQDLSIAVDSSPRGAEIFIDGFRTGYATPYTFGNISDGSHSVMVTKNGFLPKQSPVYLPFGSYPGYTAHADFELEEYPSGFLYVDSIPRGAKVSIDSMYTGEVTPALFKTVPTGIHLVEVKGTNSTKKFHDVTLNSVYLTNLTADFTPEED